MSDRPTPITDAAAFHIKAFSDGFDCQPDKDGGYCRACTSRAIERSHAELVEALEKIETIGAAVEARSIARAALSNARKLNTTTP